MAATHPNIDNTQLTKAVNDTDEIVNTLALTNHKITPEHIDHITDRSNLKLIEQALSHRNATAANFNKVAKHDDAYVRNSLIDHPGIKKNS